MAITKIDITMLEDVTGANNLVKLDSNAKIPACSAAGLSVKPGPIKNASDPAIDSNKALGTEWLNSTSGEMYICTDATTDENVWTNVGAGTGDVEPWTFQGTSYGYNAGGQRPSLYDIIDKFALASDVNATDVGNLTVARQRASGHSSTASSYASGGGNGSLSNVIDKWSNTSDGNATDVGDMTSAREYSSNSSSSTYGYIAGGSTTTGSAFVNVIEKFSVASDGNSTDAADLLTAVGDLCGGQNSETYGYVAGGSVPPAYTRHNVIQKYSFASDANSTDVGNQTVERERASGQSSTTHGYTSGGTAGTYKDHIDKFAFASDGDAVNVGDLTGTRNTTSGQSSTTYGYVCGGYPMSDIEKFAFASDGNAVDAADLTVQRRNAAGTQI